MTDNDTTPTSPQEAATSKTEAASDLGTAAEAPMGSDAGAAEPSGDAADDTGEDAADDVGDAEPARRRRSGWRIALVCGLAVVLALTLGTVGAALWLRHKISSEIETIDDPFAGLATRAPEPTPAGGAQAPVNILVLGSDSRISPNDPAHWEAGAQRTDALMIVQVSGDRQHVSVMSVPRDSWVQIPGHGENKINAAYSFGGPTLTIQTVEQLTGIHINHFVIANFESFAALTDEIGGVDLNLATDQTLAGTPFTAGRQHLTGAQALAYVRERKSLPNGDFDRVQRQQAWMRAIVAQVFSNDTLRSPSKLYGLLTAVTATMAVDESFTVDEMQSLALSLKDVRSSAIAYMTAPTTGTGTSADGQSIVLLDAAADEALFDAFRRDAVHDYLAANPTAVQTLPETVN